MKNILARACNKLQTAQDDEICLLNLKRQDKTKIELPLDMVSISASSCWTNVVDLGILEGMYYSVYLICRIHNKIIETIRSHINFNHTEQN